MACFSTLQRKEESRIKKIGASEGRENMLTDRHQTSDRGPQAVSAAAQTGVETSIKRLRDEHGVCERAQGKCNGGPAGVQRQGGRSSRKK